MNINYLVQIGAIAFVARIIYEVNFTKINKVMFKSNKMYEGTEINILQISDFHDKKLFSYKKYEKILEETSPDLILITGDLINRKSESFNNVYRFLKIFLEYKKPIYFVKGNHEFRNVKLSEFINKLKAMGVMVLENQCEILNIHDEKILLYGVEDARSKKDNLKKALSIQSDTNFSILMSHSPQVLDKYERSKIDLTILGDTHGGQIRLPFIGAIITSQGFFPEIHKGVYFLECSKKSYKKHKIGKNEYDLGLDNENCNAVYIDSGIGTHSLPIRIFNQSQISLIKIVGKKNKE